MFFRAGIRERRSRRDLDQKINIIINSQIANEERFARNEERFARIEDRFDRTDAEIRALTDAQKQTEHRLAALIEIVTKERNGRDQ